MGQTGHLARVGCRQRFRGALAALVIVLPPFLASCAAVSTLQGLGERNAPEQPPIADDAPDPGAAWWQSFGDPVLDQVVQAALESNFDLDEAVARVREAEARARVARVARLPALQALAGASDYDAPTNVGLGAQLDELGLGSDAFQGFGVVLPDRLGLETYSAAAEFAYELDFWGRNEDSIQAVEAQARAAESDFETARIGVLARTVGTYLEVVDLRRQRALAGEIATLLRDWESLAAARYAAGLTAAPGLYAVRRNRHDAEAQLPALEQALGNAEGRLWVLVGRHREDLAKLLPDALAQSGTRHAAPDGVPAELLAQRPDVQAAEQRMKAARLALGAQRAALLPTISISGTVGLQSADAGDWFAPDQWLANLSANLLAPVLQAGRLRGNVAVAEARFEATVAAYGRAVVAAATETQSALAGLAASRRRLDQLVAQEAVARADAALREQHYVAGLASYADHLAAQQVRLGAESARAAGERDLGYAKLELHRALGGAWHFDDATAAVLRATPAHQRLIAAAAD